MSKFIIINTNNIEAKGLIGKIGVRIQGKVGSHAIIHLEEGMVWETSTIQKIDKHDSFCRIQTRNSYYEFERIEEKIENPFKKYFIVATLTTEYNYDVSTEVWANGCKVEKGEAYGEEYWILYKNETLWFNTTKDKEDYKKHNNVPIIKEGTWIFDESFLEFCKKAENEIHNSGEFAFAYRKKLRKQYREEICKRYTGLARKNALTYFKQYC